MDPPKLIHLPHDVRESLDRMNVECDIWKQDDDGDVSVVSMVPGVDKHIHFVYIWCGQGYHLWSFAVIENDVELDEETPHPALLEVEEGGDPTSIAG
jgi:hypothetical protein